MLIVAKRRVQQWTRLIRFVAVETAQVHVGEPIDGNLDSMFTLVLHPSIHSSLRSLTLPSVGLAIHNGQTVKAYEILGSAIDPAAQVSSNVLTVKQLLSPLSREQVGIVRCLGLNYADHAVRPLSRLLPYTFVSNEIIGYRLKRRWKNQSRLEFSALSPSPS